MAIVDPNQSTMGQTPTPNNSPPPSDPTTRGFGNQYTNISDLLRANSGKIADVNSQVQSGLTDAATAGQTNATGALGTYESNLSASNQFDPALIQKGLSNPGSLTSDERAKFTAMTSGTINKPQSLQTQQDYLNAQNTQNQLKQTGQLLNSAGGAGGFVNQALGTQGAGNQSFTAGLFSGSGGGAAAQNTANTGATTLANTLTGEDTQAATDLTNAKNTAASNQNDFQNQLNSKVSGLKSQLSSANSQANGFNSDDQKTLDTATAAEAKAEQNYKDFHDQYMNKILDLDGKHPGGWIGASDSDEYKLMQSADKERKKQQKIISDLSNKQSGKQTASGINDLLSQLSNLTGQQFSV